jgi:hypothetical protein
MSNYELFATFGYKRTVSVLVSGCTTQVLSVFLHFIDVSCNCCVQSLMCYPTDLGFLGVKRNPDLFFHILHLPLKGLSHEIDFKNFDQTLKNLT